jgi:hemoglobin-like flavoprotein
MTIDQKQLIRQTFSTVAPIANQAAALFYAKLFELDPSLRVLFRGDMKKQGQKLMQALAFAVKGLDQMEQLVPVLQEMGRRHVVYGVKETHYATVGEALIATLAQALGPDFTPEARNAWIQVYGVLATVMKEAASMTPSELKAVN